MKIENEGNINAREAIANAVLRSGPEHSVALDHLREVTM